MVGMTKTVGALGRSVVGLGVALTVSLAGGLALAAKQGADFEESIVRVGSIVNATDATLRHLAATARDFGETTVFSAVQSAEAMREFSQAGFTVDQTLKALRPTLNFAIAGMLSISEAADIAARVMFSMGLEAEDLSDSLEVLTKAFTLAPVSVIELGEAFKFVGPVGRAAGKDIQELTSFLVVFARAGLRGEQAGTALRNILLRLQAQPSEVKKALQALNVTIADSEGKMRSLADILEDINMATVNMTQVEKQAIISKIAGIRATAAFSAAMNTGAEAIREVERELRINSGTMDRLAKNQLKTMTSKVLLLKSAMVELGITINDIFGGSIKSAIDKATGMAKSLSDWVQANQKLTSGLIVGTAGLAALTVAAGLAMIAVAGLTLTWIAFSIALAAGALPALATIGFLTAFVGSILAVGLAAFATGIAISMWASGLNKAKGELMELNRETEKAVELQKALARTQTNIVSLWKQRSQAMSEGNALGQARAELALIKQTQEAVAIQIARAKELLAVRQRLGGPTGFDEKSIAKLNEKMRMLVAMEKESIQFVEESIAAQKQLNAAKAISVQLVQETMLREKITAKITEARMALLAKINPTLAKTLAIQKQTKELEAQFSAEIAKSNLGMVKKELLIAKVQDALDLLAAAQLANLNKASLMEVAMFLATEEEKAQIQLSSQRKRLLALTKGLKDEAKLRSAIEKKFLMKAEELKKEFSGSDSSAAAPSGPGALIAGTVEAFKAAFRSNPALDESKKQTKEQISIKQTVKSILKKLDGLDEENKVNQIIIAD